MIHLVLYANYLLGLTYRFLIKKKSQEIQLFICHCSFITLAQNTIGRRQIVRFLETLQTCYTVLPILELEIIKVLFFTFSIELHGIYFLIQYLSFKNFAECTFFVVVVFCTFAVCGVLLFFHNSCPEYG